MTLITVFSLAKATTIQIKSEMDLARKEAQYK